jgi:hypothetical protein
LFVYQGEADEKSSLWRDGAELPENIYRSLYINKKYKIEERENRNLQ